MDDVDIDEILAMKLNDLEEYVDKKICEMGLFAVDPHLLVNRNRCDLLEFLGLHVVPHKHKQLLLNSNKGAVMTGMFSEDETDSATTDQKF